MFEVNKNNIRMVRGDTGTIKLDLTLDSDEQAAQVYNDSTEPAEKKTLEPDSYLATMTVKKSVDDIAYIFQKLFSNGELTIEHNDTNNLPYGTYVYDIQITLQEDNSVHTLGTYTLTILPDVTRN